MSSTDTPQPTSRWRYKPHRGLGSFVVVRVTWDRVTLRNRTTSRDKTISIRTLHGDYEPDV